MTVTIRDAGGPSDEHDPFAGPAILATVATTEPQREVWVAAQMSEEASLAYNESVTLWMRGPVDEAALAASLREVVGRHDALRSTFSGDGLTMMIGAGDDLPIRRVDAAELPAHEREAQWEALLVREVTEPFDLVRGPPARVAVYRAGSEEHRVVFTAHHIVCDGWSTAVILRDWAALYSARAGGGPATLPAIDSFESYARQDAAGTGTTENEEYWVSRYADAVPTLELPVDRPRPPVKTYASRREDLVLDEGLIRDLRRLGSGERASLFATLLAGYQLLLARLSGQRDVVVGVPAAGQASGGHEELVGHCVHMLPLRAQLDFEKPFRTLLSDTRRVVLEAYDHQRYTFGSLLKRLPLARDASRLPLVSVIFNLDRGLRDDALQFGGLATRLTTNPRRFETFDVFINAVELDGEVTLECQYNVDLFDAPTVRRWLRTYARLLRSACEHPDERIGWLTILTDDDRAALRGWNAETARAVPDELCVHDLVEAQVRRSPDAVAVEHEGTTLTYAALDARANVLAGRLRAAGVGRGALVGLCVERGVQLVIGVVGILKAGAAYVPLDPGYPAPRLAFMVQDAGMAALVTQGALAEELGLDAPLILRLDGLAAAPAVTSDVPPVRPADPAYVIYTSGSTGQPKGVLVPHRAVVNLLTSVRETPGMAATDTVLAVTTLSFDIAVSEILLPLTVGARIVLASREVASDGDRLLALLRSSRATFLDATPATWRLLLAAGWSGGEGLKGICTGEALPRDLAAELVGRCASVWNGYGPTETTVWSTFWRVPSPVGRVLIGKPIANTQARVLDERMQEIPIGVVGELYIGGAGVTLGYHRRPELTRSRFLPDPFGTADARMYKTGDLVRFLPDGNLECLGRNDSQVKLRGFRIELGEIESVLAQHPSVTEAAVIVREDRPGDLRLVAYAVQRQGAVLSDSELRGYVKRTLPDYMVPAHFVLIGAIPRLPNGKIDRQHLPRPQAPDADDAGGGFVEPRTPTEKMLAELWQEVLGVGRVGAHDDFFALGGHSLLASQAIARLRRDHGIEVNFRKMFESPTIERLGAAIDASSGTDPHRRPSVIPPRADAGPAPLSIAQRRFWLLEEMDPSQRLVHNLCASWLLEGELDVPAMQRTIDAMVQRHEVLRTSFRAEREGPVQVPHAERPIHVHLVDLGERTPPEQEAALSAGRDAQAAAPFDLSRDPLLRVTIYKLAADRHILSTVQHNIVWDGWSFDVFLGELTALYPVMAAGGPNALQPLSISYADFASWQRVWVDSPEFERQASFWRSRLVGTDRPLELPTDHPRQGMRSHAGGSAGIHITADRVRALLSLARESGATLFMVLFAAYGVLLHRYTGQREFVVGVPTRARTRPELEGLLGLFVNTIPLRFTVDPSMSFAQLVERVREATLDAFEHQDVPMDALGVRAPMLRALFSLQDARGRPAQMGNLRVTQDHALAPVAASELMLWAMESKADLLLMFNYASDLFEAASIRRLLEGLDALLGGVEVDPRQLVGMLPILGPQERRMLAQANRAAVPAVTDVFAVVRAWATRRPEGIAIEDDDHSWTYSQLVLRVKEGVDELFRRGGSPGSRIAIRMSRPDDQLAGVLAVMAIGATLVLDAGEPANIVLTGPAQAVGVAEPHPGAADVSGAIAYVHHGIAARQGPLAQALVDIADVAGLAPDECVEVAAGLEGYGALCATLLPLVAGARLRLTSSPTTRVAGADPPTVLLVSPGDRHASATPPARTLVVGVTSPSLWTRVRQVPGPAFAVHLSDALALPISVCVGVEDRPSMGRPLRGARWRVVDAGGQLAPMSAGGALHIDAGGGEVATGDRVRLLADGTFEHQGRTDGRVQLEADLVNPREIAGALERHPAVREAWVSARQDATGRPRLVAYWVPRNDARYTETELRDSVRTALGDRMVPRTFVELDALPREVTGAVDDARLASPYAPDAAQEYVPPGTEQEKFVSGLWQQALGVARIGIHDNFFDLGGHSLLCFRLIARIEKETGKRISPRVVLLNSLQQVAAELEGTAGGQPGASPGPPPAEHSPDASGARRVLSWLRSKVKR